MSSLVCPPPWWAEDHISVCVQKAYLELILPLAAVLSSSFIIAFQLYQRQQLSHRQGFQPVARDDNDDEPPEALIDQDYGTNVTLTMPARLLETSALVLDIGFCLILSYRVDQTPSGTFFFSIYLLALVSVRLRVSKLNHTLRPHSEILYCAQWMCLFLLAHAAWVENPGDAGFWLSLARLVLFSCLVLVHWASSRLPEHSQGQGAGGANMELLSREDTASFISRLIFGWMEPLLWEAFRTGPLTAARVENTYPLNRRLASNVSTTRFRAVPPTLGYLWRIFHLLKWDLFQQGLWATITGVLVFVPPLLIKLLLEYLESTSIRSATAWLYVLSLVAASVTAGIADCQCGWTGYMISSKLRAVLLDEIYAKVMRRRVVKMGPSSESQPAAGTEYASDGAIYNFVSGDIDFISSMSGNLYLVWVTFPIQILIGTGLLYQLLGLSGVLGVVLMMALLPLNILVSKRLAAVQSQLLQASDARIQSDNELIGAIRIIKYYAWEAPFRARVLRKREAELKVMRTRFVWWSISMTIFYSLPFIVTILTFFFYTLVWHGTLNTTIAFPALATFAVLRIPLNRMADSITFLIQAHVSLRRVTDFLKERETEKPTQSRIKEAHLIGFDNAILSWPLSVPQSTESEMELPSRSPFRLQGLNFALRPDTLNVICGASGSGKSSLLLAMLGEMRLERGEISLPQYWLSKSSDHVDFLALQETTAYCPHEPWIVNQSIRANILLELPFNASRYEEVLRSVALVEDLALMSHGDLTQAGEKGNRLSGGQKQRVSLARALYSTSKYVLLDDCLSALDSRTARHIFFHGVKGPLLKNRLCVLATHHTQLTIPHSDFVVVLEAGKVQYQGPLGAQDIFLNRYYSSVPDQGEVETDTGMLHDDSNVQNTDHLPDNDGAQKESDSGEGAVSWDVVTNYLKDLGSKLFWVMVLAGFAAQQLVALGTNLWIKRWAFQYDKIGSGQPQFDDVKADEGSPVASWYYLSVYTAVCGAYALATLLRDLITFSGSLKASATIHDRLLHSVTSAKFAFFERPAGQITNRFSKDVNVVDQSLATFAVSAFQIAASVIMVIILIIWAIPRLVLFLGLGVICLAYFLITALYIQGAQDLKRMEAKARSPLYQQVGETIAGYVSIRGYGREALFTAKLHTLIDGLNQPYLLLWASKQWLTMRVNMLSSAIILIIGVYVVWEAASVDVGIAGLVLTYAATFTENMLWFVQIYAIIQESLTSVERIAEYSSVEQETATLATRAAGPPPSILWPEKGAVTFHSLTARYGRDLPPVLRSISFNSPAGQRIAVVGRTGAGKSSISLALLRVLDADPDEGWIEVDGVDIATVPLDVLRGRAVTIIPQDPHLFAGNVRSNVDPLGKHTDAEIRSVLQSMQNDTDSNYFDLDKQASDLSRGQSQLMCVARGLLRKTPILVLDEATANVDHDSDKAIQRGLRAFVARGDTTVITIAHRLLTIADYDRVLVLDAGRVVEEGSIKELLGRRSKGVVFQSLCEESGDLREIRRMTGT